MVTNKEELKKRLKWLQNKYGIELKDMRSYIPDCMLCSKYDICNNNQSIRTEEMCKVRINNWLHAYASPQSSSRISKIVEKVKTEHYYKIKSYRDTLLFGRKIIYEPTSSKSN